jgi:hypothetical protein
MGKACLGASVDRPSATTLSPRERCARYESEKLPDDLFRNIEFNSKFERDTSGRVSVSVTEFHHGWIITEIGMDVTVDVPGIAPQTGRVFWRGYKEPPGDIYGSDAHTWLLGYLDFDTDRPGVVPNDLWRVSRLTARGIDVRK